MMFFFFSLTNIQLYVGIFDHVGVVRIYINSVLYGICKFIKMHQKQVFLCNENEIYWCLFDCYKKNFLKSFFKYLYIKTGFLVLNHWKHKDKKEVMYNNWCTLTKIFQETWWKAPFIVLTLNSLHEKIYYMYLFKHRVLTI